MTFSVSDLKRAWNLQGTCRVFAGAPRNVEKAESKFQFDFHAFLVKCDFRGFSCVFLDFWRNQRFRVPWVPGVRKQQ